MRSVVKPSNLRHFCVLNGHFPLDFDWRPQFNLSSSRTIFLLCKSAMSSLSADAPSIHIFEKIWGEVRALNVSLMWQCSQGWMPKGELLNAPSHGDKCMCVLKPSLSRVASLVIIWEWSIFFPTFDKHSLMRGITLVSNFCMRLKSWGICFGTCTVEILE